MSRKNRLVRTRFGEVAVRESEGKGAPVLLIHGNSLSAESFTRQLSGDPGSRFRMIAFDLPGHGDSPRAVAPEKTYRMSVYVELVKDLIGLLDLRDPAVAGHSLGGHIALEAITAGMRPRSLMIFGTPPLGNPPDVAAAFHIEVLGGAATRADLSKAEIAQFAASFMPRDVQPPAYYARSIAATDPVARKHMGDSMVEDPLADERAAIGSLRAPVAVLHGEMDRVVNVDYIRRIRIPSLWRGSVQIIHGAGHCPQYDNAEAFNRLLLDFLSETAG